jgi:hypothetical protein
VTRARLRASALTGAAAIAAAAAFVGLGSLIQDTGCTQTAHYSLLRALGDGTAAIDPWHWDTCDKSWTDGRFYSAKAPGLSFLALAPYAALHALGAVPGDLQTAIWLLGLLVVVAPAIALAGTAAWVARGIEPGSGWAVAFLLGAATLVLPFSTLVFGHVLSAALAFGAFALLVAERGGPARASLVAGAGGLAGLAATVDYPAALAALALTALVLARAPRLRRLAAYVGGGLVGVLPLPLYNVWAFGSPTHLSYVNAVIIQGGSGHDVVGAASDGFFGVTTPTPRIALELLLSERGLLTLTPVVAAAVFGLVLLALSRDRRAEALTALGVAALFLAYNAGIKTTFGGPFGGDSPGPRYLVVALPFAAVGLAVALRRFPFTTAALAVPSVLTMAAATVTQPMIDAGGAAEWAHSLRSGAFADSVVTLAGAPRPLAALPFLAALVVVACVVLRRSPLRRPSRSEALAAAVVAAAWLMLVFSAPETLERAWLTGDRWPVVSVALLLAAAAAVAVRAHARPTQALAGLVPLAVAASLPYGSPWVLAAAALALALAALPPLVGGAAWRAPE